MNTELESTLVPGRSNGQFRAQPTRIHAQELERRSVITLDRPAFQQRFISARRDALDELSIFDDLPPTSETVVAQMVFGGCHYHGNARNRMKGTTWPMLWLQGDVCPGTEISGMSAFTLR